MSVGCSLIAGTCLAATSESVRSPILVPQMSHDTAITAAAWSQDGHLIATGARNSTIVIWDLVSGRIANRLPIAPSLEERGEDSSARHELQVTSISFSGTDQFLAATESFYSGTHTRIWSTSDWRMVCDIRSSFVGWLPHAERLVLRGDRNVSIVEARDCRQVLQLSSHSVSLGPVDLSPDGRWIAHASSSRYVDHDDRVIISDAASGSDKLIVRPDPEGADDVAFAEGGRTLMIRGHGRKLYVYDIASERLTWRFDLNTQGCEPGGSIFATEKGNLAALSCTWIADARYVDRTVVIDLRRRIVTERFNGAGRALTPTGWLVMDVPDTQVTSELHSREAVRLDTGERTGLGPQIDEPIAFARDGSRFLASRIVDPGSGAYVPESNSRRANIPQISAMPDGHLIKSLNAPLRPEASRVAVSDDGRLLATITSRSAEDVQDLSVFSLPGLTLQRSISGVPGWKVAFLPASHVLLLEGGADALLVDPEDGSTHTLPFLTVAPVQGASGMFVATNSDGRVVLYDQAHSRVLRVFEAPSGAAALVASASQDRVAAALHVIGKGGSHWGELAAWKLSTGEYVGSADMRLGAIARVMLSRDEKEIIAAESYTHVARAWSLSDLKNVRSFSGRKDGVGAMAQSRDGIYLVTAGSGYGADRAVQVWDYGGGKVLATLDGHTADIEEVSFLGASYGVLVQTKDGVIKLWDAPSGDHLATLYRVANSGWITVDAQGRFDTSGRVDGDLMAWLTPDEPHRALPFQTFMKDFYTPGLLKRYIDCEAGRKTDPGACAKVFPAAASSGALAVRAAGQ